MRCIVLRGCVPCCEFVIKFMKRKQNQNYNKIRLQPLRVQGKEFCVSFAAAVVFVAIAYVFIMLFSQKMFALHFMKT